MKIKVWTDEDAQRFFKGIEANIHKEWYDVDWKREMCWESTTLQKNTTQRAISGFSNTIGGKVIIGFDDSGKPIGWKEIVDVENHIADKLNRKLEIIPIFKTKTYDYNGVKILVIFIGSSKEPIQCDDGVYYYREQSQFKFMPHHMLKDKFKKVFTDEMFVDLVERDLESLMIHLKTMDRSRTVGYNVSAFTKHFIESAEKLYFYYKERGLLPDYFGLLNLIRQWIADQGNVIKEPGQFTLIEGKIQFFLTALFGKVDEDESYPQ